jgi:hypothetical protein
MNIEATYSRNAVISDDFNHGFKGKKRDPKHRPMDDEPTFRRNRCTL